VVDIYTPHIRSCYNGNEILCGTLPNILCKYDKYFIKNIIVLHGGYIIENISIPKADQAQTVFINEFSTGRINHKLIVFTSKFSTNRSFFKSFQHMILIYYNIVFSLFELIFVLRINTNQTNQKLLENVH